MESTEVWFWFWVVAAAFLFVAEIFTAGFFMLPFGIGAAAAAALAFFQVPAGWQWGGFIVISTASFVLLRRFADHLTHEPPVKTGIDRLVGKTGIVIEDLTPDSPVGQVRIEREEWRADAPSCDVIPVGTRVVVEGIEGTHLIVRPEVGGRSE
ncbi:MAG: NfeD family protein [Coriobacteriia bacterium]|nr:NfeD family protein [Coriobacteriia bacterium]